MTLLAFGEMVDTPAGAISFAASAQGIKAVGFCTMQALRKRLNYGLDTPSLDGYLHVTQLLTELMAYFSGNPKPFAVPVDFSSVTAFQKTVYLAACEIPIGGIITYAQLAQKIAQPKAIRAVAFALAANPLPIIIPCHRVIGTDGKLHGYNAPNGIQTKALLLSLEGVSLELG